MFRLGYLVRKLAILVLTLLAVATFNFILFLVLPGNPIQLQARAGNLSPPAASARRAGRPRARTAPPARGGRTGSGRC